MICENCLEPIWNVVNYELIFNQMLSYVKQKYGKEIAKKWESIFVKRTSGKKFCPWCYGHLAVLYLKRIVGKKDRFLEKWFVKIWEGL